MLDWTFSKRTLCAVAYVLQSYLYNSILANVMCTNDSKSYLISLSHQLSWFGGHRYLCMNVRKAMWTTVTNVLWCREATWGEISLLIEVQILAWRLTLLIYCQPNSYFNDILLEIQKSLSRKILWKCRLQSFLYCCCLHYCRREHDCPIILFGRLSCLTGSGPLNLLITDHW